MTATLERELTAADYELFRALIYDKCGINLGEQKQQLVRARLGKRLRAGGFTTFRAYYDYVASDATGHELCTLIDAVSTNTTHLFREKQHFNFLAHTVRNWLADPRWRHTHDAVRVWSAGCSSGEEPYSIAMTLDDCIGSRAPWKLLATDISTTMLARARSGRYEAHRLGTVPINFRQRYFAPAADADPTQTEVLPALRARITFSRLNLMDASFPFRHGFHCIFCRNVMIYFDRPTQAALVRRFAQHLRPGGFLLIGHSESLNGLDHGLRYVQPTIYQKGP